MRTVTHAYDLNNRRISRFVDEGSNGSIENRDYFYYDGENVALTLAQNMNVEHRYLHGPRVDQILADEAFDETTGAFIDTYWTLTDHQGSVRDVLSAPGVRFEHIRYSGFGQIAQVRNGSTIDPTKTPTVSYAYTGREWDPATNLQYNRNRWYDPSTGRWISQDPIGFSAGYANLYQYVANSPLSFRDPMGLDEPRGPIQPPTVAGVLFKLPTGGICSANLPLTGKQLQELAKGMSGACECVVTASNLLREYANEIRQYYKLGQRFNWLFSNQKNLQFYIDRLTQLANRCRSAEIKINCGTKKDCGRRDTNEKGVNAYTDYDIWGYPLYPDQSVINICPDNFYQDHTDKQGILVWELGRTVGFGGEGGSETIDDPNRFGAIVDTLCKDADKIKSLRIKN